MTTGVRASTIAALLAAVLLFAACGDSSADKANRADPATPSAVGDSGADFVARMGMIDDAVTAWRDAATTEAAHEAAETAANLIVGPSGPGYGDRNGDGIIGGDSNAGVLPGTDGTPEGLAGRLASSDCLARDVLGGPWTDPGGRWEAMLDAIDSWTPLRNTMPTLPSHPMRIVGWATFTLATDSLDEAHEYAGHAKLHVDISLRAVDC